LLLLALMVFFTFLTAYAVFSGKIRECGCFGDCIPLQAMQSFIKDLILLVLVIILVLGRKHIHPLFSKPYNTALMILSFSVSLFIQWYALQHLPYVDCLPYKKGNNIWNEMQLPANATPDVYQTSYELKNSQSGETKTMLDQEYLSSGIWEDTTWQIVGEPVTKLVEKGSGQPAITDFKVTDYEGNDYTEALLKEPGYNFVLFIKDVHSANTRHMDRLRDLIAQCAQSNVGFYILSANSQEQTAAFVEQHQLKVDYFVIDGTVCKTAMRSNPGLMLIKAGTVKGKWSYNDYPKGFNLQNDRMQLK